MTVSIYTFYPTTAKHSDDSVTFQSAQKLLGLSSCWIVQEMYSVVTDENNGNLLVSQQTASMVYSINTVHVAKLRQAIAGSFCWQLGDSLLYV